MPRTIENTAILDETVLLPDDKEVAQDDKTDEFSMNFCSSPSPKVLITSSNRPSLKSHLFMRDLSKCIPNSCIRLRRGIDVKKLLPVAARRGYSAVVVVNEDRKIPDGLLMVHLPEGPSMHFKVTSFTRGYDIKVSLITAWTHFCVTWITAHYVVGILL